MKSILFSLLAMISLNVAAQNSPAKLPAEPDKSKPVLTLETSCGECQFKLPGKGCDLAVKVDGKAYFVEGTRIDDHGDAHDKDGFCNAVRLANVQGQIVNDKFKVTYFKLLPPEPKN